MLLLGESYNVEGVAVASGYDKVTLAQNDETSASFRTRFDFDVKSHVILHTCKLYIKSRLTHRQSVIMPCKEADKK